MSETKRYISKPEKNTPKGIGEIGIRIPAVANKVAHNFFFTEESKKVFQKANILYISCDLVASISDLRKKLSRRVKIPCDYLSLVFLGKILSDKEVIPRRCFEVTQTVDSDEDIFRPRICLSIDFGTRQKSRPRDLDLIASQSESSDLLEIGKEIGDTMIDEGVWVSITSERPDINKSKGHITTVKSSEEKVDSFELYNELEKIDCSIFFDDLKSAGYDSQGSFSELEEADLSVLWIPRRARVRILTLAGAMRRRIAVFTQQIEAKSYKNLEKQLLGSSSIKALAIDGDDKIYTTKAELKRAWERAAKDESKHQHEDIIQRKEHTIDLQVKIDAIKRTKDDDVARKILPYKSTTMYCCSKHEGEAKQSRELFVAKRKITNKFDLENNLRRADRDGTGFTPRDVLSVLAQETTKKCFHNLIPEKELSLLLDSCLMSKEGQIARQDWLSEKERFHNLGKVPIPQYDTDRFTRKVVDLISYKDIERFI